MLFYGGRSGVKFCLSHITLKHIILVQSDAEHKCETLKGDKEQ